MAIINIKTDDEISSILVSEMTELGRITENFDREGFDYTLEFRIYPAETK